MMLAAYLASKRRHRVSWNGPAWPCEEANHPEPQGRCQWVHTAVRPGVILPAPTNITILLMVTPSSIDLLFVCLGNASSFDFDKAACSGESRLYACTNSLKGHSGHLQATLSK